MSTVEDDRKVENISGLEAYKIALDTRNLEIGLFWQRSNYFLVLNSALAIGFFRLADDKYSILLAFLGMFVSFLWYRVNLGSKYWQARWEHCLNKKENEIAEGLGYFSANSTLIQADVIESFSHGADKKGWFQKWLEKQVLKKPSVSYNMTLLSLVFVCVWALLVLIKLFSSEV